MVPCGYVWLVNDIALPAFVFFFKELNILFDRKNGCSVEQTLEQSHQLTVHSPKLSCGETSRNDARLYHLFNLKVTYALEVPVGRWKWPNFSRKSCTCMMCNATFGFGTDTIKIYSTPVIKCQTSNLPYPPFYPKQLSLGSGTFMIFQTLY